MRVGLVVDHPNRDLGGIVRIAFALASRNVKTFLIPLYDQGVDIPLLNLDVIIVNYARPTNLDLVAGYAKQGISIFVLDTEGGVFSEVGANSISGLVNYIGTSSYTHLIDGYFFWGNRLHNAFLNSGILSPSRLHLTGCPRFDFASARWRDVLQYPLKDYILINTNFPLINPSFTKDISEEVRVMIKNGWDHHYINKMAQDQNGILIGLLETVCRLAVLFPEKHFLIRPHPFEDFTVYRKRFESVFNVTVDGSGNVFNVIRHCACLLHLNCGTSVEAVMLGRLPISIEFLNTDHMANHSTLPSQISMKANNFEHLVAIINDLPKYYQIFDFDTVYREHIYNFFYENDGFAGDRVADVILTAPTRTERSGIFRRIVWSLASSRETSRLSQRIQALFANILGSRITTSLRSKLEVVRRRKMLDIDTVRNLVGLLAQHNRSPEPLISYASHPISKLPLSSISISLLK